MMDARQKEQRAKHPNLGQDEAAEERLGKDKMEHMEGDAPQAQEKQGLGQDKAEKERACDEKLEHMGGNRPQRGKKEQLSRR